MLHVPSFTPAPPAHEVPDTVLDTGNTEERREEKPGRHSCPGGGAPAGAPAVAGGKAFTQEPHQVVWSHQHGAQERSRDCEKLEGILTQGGGWGSFPTEATVVWDEGRTGPCLLCSGYCTMGGVFP